VSAARPPPDVGGFRRPAITRATDSESGGSPPGPSSTRGKPRGSG
jgi:hypothetical protein